MSTAPPNPSANSGPDYKDQMREVAGPSNGTDDLPAVASASSPGSGTASANRPAYKDQLREDNSPPPSLPTERLALQQQQQQQPPPSQDSQPNDGGITKKQWLIVGFLTFAVIAATSVGIAFAIGGNSSPSPVPPTTNDRATSIREYINSVSLSSAAHSYPSQANPQEQALQWLIDDDVTTDASDLLSLRQRFALVTTWFANGPFDSAHTDTWLSSMDVCQWESVRDCVNGEVAWLLLWDDGLSGAIPADLGLLTAMTRLDLDSNQLTGTIPSQILSLSSLRYFYVYDNNLTGRMPFCDGDSSRFIRLSAECEEVDCPCCTHCCPSGAVSAGSQCVAN